MSRWSDSSHLTGRRLPQCVYKNSLSRLQRLELECKLDVHDGCVNSICWSERGDILLSGSDDHQLNITDPFSQRRLVSINSGHTHNIFSAAFLADSNNNDIVSCCGGGEIFLTTVDRPDTWAFRRFTCHFGVTFSVLAPPQEPFCFFSCGDDNTVRFYDIRVKDHCEEPSCSEDVLIHSPRAATAISLSERRPNTMAVGSSDGCARVFDRRQLRTGANASHRENEGLIRCYAGPRGASGITSLQFAPDCHDLLVSYSAEQIYMFSENATEVTGECLEAPDVGEDEVRPLRKRVRLRGDWSDTGPASHLPNSATTNMQRISDLLTNWISSPQGIGSQSEAIDTYRNILRIGAHSSPPSSQENTAGTASAESSADSSAMSPSTSREEEPMSSWSLQDKPSNDEEDEDERRDARARQLQKFYRRRLEDRKARREAQQLRKQKYSGHRNSRTMMKEVNFWGTDYIISGSDCGHIFFWDRYTQKVVLTLEGDGHVVNCVQPHPTLPLLASSGIDHDIKLWAPTRPGSEFDEAAVTELCSHNAALLEETRSTVTVPTSFMFRLLAGLASQRAEAS